MIFLAIFRFGTLHQSEIFTFLHFTLTKDDILLQQFTFTCLHSTPLLSHCIKKEELLTLIKLKRENKKHNVTQQDAGKMPVKKIILPFVKKIILPFATSF